MTNDSTALTTFTDGGFNDRQVNIIRTQIAPEATDDQLALFLEVCRGTGLNPFMRQIYAVFRNAKENIRGADGRDNWRTVKRMTIQTGIDGYRLLAARTGSLAGIGDATFDTEDDEHPNKASVTVWRFVAGHRVAFTATARWREYAQEKDEYHDGKKTGHKTYTDMWLRMPYLMLGKCAEALALRKAFPAELSGIYTADEMAQAENEPPISPSTNPQPPKLPTTRRQIRWPEPTQEDLDEEDGYLAEMAGISDNDNDNDNDDADEDEAITYAVEEDEDEPAPTPLHAPTSKPATSDWHPMKDVKFIASLRDIKIISAADQESFISAALMNYPTETTREACRKEYARRFNEQKNELKTATKAKASTRGRGPSALGATSGEQVPESLESLPVGQKGAEAMANNNDNNNEPMTDARLAEIRATLADDSGIGDIAARLQSDWMAIRFSAQVAQAALDLLAEVERLRAEIHGWEQVAAEERHTREIAQGRYGSLLGEKSRLELRVAELEAVNAAIVTAQDAVKYAEMRWHQVTRADSYPESEVRKADRERVMALRTRDEAIEQARALFAPGESEA